MTVIIQDTRPTPFGDDTPPSAPFVVDCQAVWVIVEDCADDLGATCTIEKLRVDGLWGEIQTISVMTNYLIEIAGVYRIGTIASCRCVIVKTEVKAGSCVEGGSTAPCDCTSPYISDGTDGCPIGEWVDETGCTGVFAQGPQGEIGTEGPVGATGADGAVGAVGPQGDIGAQGPEGPQGIQGNDGADGSGVIIIGSDTIENILLKTGAAIGDMWITTNDGVDGAGQPVLDGDGIIWDGVSWIGVGPIRGPDGDQGPEGAQGIQGAQGDVGPVGPEGPPGTGDGQNDPVGSLRLTGDTTVEVPSTDWIVLPVFNELTMQRGGIIVDAALDTITVSEPGYYNVLIELNFEVNGSSELQILLFSDGAPYSSSYFAVQGDGVGKPQIVAWVSNINIYEAPHVFDVRARNGDNGIATVDFLRTTFTVRRGGDPYVAP